MNSLPKKVTGKLLELAESKPAKKEMLSIDSLKNTINKVVEQHNEIERLKKEQELVLSDLRQTAVDKMLEKEQLGIFENSIVFKGDVGNIRISRKNSFATITNKDKALLQEILKDNYDKLFVEQTGVDLKVSPETLIRACQGCGLNVDYYFNIKEIVKPTVSYMQRRHELRNKLSTEENETIDKVTEAKQHNPSVNFI